MYVCVHLSAVLTKHLINWCMYFNETHKIIIGSTATTKTVNISTGSPYFASECLNIHFSNTLRYN